MDILPLNQPILRTSSSLKIITRYSFSNILKNSLPILKTLQKIFRKKKKKFLLTNRNKIKILKVDKKRIVLIKINFKFRISLKFNKMNLKI